MVARTKPGTTKRTRQGLSTIPRVAWPTVADVLAERGWLGLVPFVAVCHLGGTDVEHAVVDDNGIVVYVGRRSRRFPLPEEALGQVREFLDAFASETAGLLPARRERYVAEILAGEVQPEVQHRLRAAGHRWAPWATVSITTLRRVGVEQMLADHAGHREFVRAYLRSPRAHPEDAMPDATEDTMQRFDKAVAPFWAAVAERLSPGARDAIARLAPPASTAQDL